MPHAMGKGSFRGVHMVVIPMTDYTIYGKDLDRNPNYRTFLVRALRRAGLRDSQARWCESQYLPKENPYVLLCGSYALHKILPNADLVYCQGIPVKAHGKVIFAVDHPYTIMQARDSYRNWERQLRLFASLINNMVVTIQTIQDMTAHCFYCDKPKFGGSITCHKHASTLLRDRATNLIPPMTEPTLFDG